MAARSLSTQLTQVVMKVRVFGEIVGWLAGDLYQHAKGLLITIFALNVIGVISRLGMIAVLMTFVHAQTSGRPVVVRGFELPSDSGFWTLMLWGSLVLLLSVTTGVVNYLAEVKNFRLAREAMDRTVDQTLAVVAAGQSRPLTVWANEGMKAMARKVVMGDAMMLARSVLLIGGVTVSVTTFVLATVVLFILNAQLTAILAPVFLVYAVPFYKLNRAVVNASRDYDDLRLERAYVLGGLLRFASQTQYPGIIHPVWTERYQADPSVSGAMDAFRGIIMPRRRVAFLQDVFIGVILLVSLVGFGSTVLSDKSAWVPFLTYFVFLRYSLTGMGGTATMVTAVNRFVPQLRRLKEFVFLDVEAAAVGIDKEEKLWTFQAAGSELKGSALSAKPQPGDFIACIDPCPTDSYCLVEFCQRLLGTNNRIKCNHLLGAMFYCGDIRSFPGLSIMHILTGEKESDSTTIDQAKRVLERLGVLNEIEALPMGVQTILGPETTEELSQLCFYALCLVPGIRSSKRYFVLDWKPLGRMGSEARKAVFDILSDRIVLLDSKRTPADLLSQASLVFVLDEAAIIGIGDAEWFNRVARQHLLDIQDTVAVGGDGDKLLSDEEEMVDDL